jgi:uncharacterized protein YkwD
MKRAAQLGIAGLVLLAIGFAAGDVVGYNQGQDSPKATAKVTKAPNPPTRAQLLKLVNAERAKHGVAPLKEDSRLDKSAQEKSDAEAKHHHFGHMYKGAFNGAAFAKQTGIVCEPFSENLAWVTNGSLETAEAAIDWWMSSKPHRKALLNTKYTLTGFGIIHSGVAEHFCQVP